MNNNPVESQEKRKIETVADLRADFMRRWFAVAISVGFATTVVSMDWVREGKAPDYEEWEQLARLSVALVATVLSWEGYLLSIQRKPLNDLSRYFLDVFLVFLYLFLLLTSKFSHFWLFLHAITFTLYMIWDFLTIAWYRDKFVRDGATLPSIFDVYSGGLIGSRLVDRGPVITIWWAIYFILLYVISLRTVQHGTFIFSTFVLLGLGFYRLDKRNWRDRPVVGPMAIVILLLAAWGAVCAAQRLT